MQVFNDSLYLSDRLQALTLSLTLGQDQDRNQNQNRSSSPAQILPMIDFGETIRRLRESGESIFERQVEIQREGLLVKLDDVELEGMGNEALFKVSERKLKEIERDLKNLGGVLKVCAGVWRCPGSTTVLPSLSYFSSLPHGLDIRTQFLLLRNLPRMERDEGYSMGNATLSTATRRRL